MRLIRSASLAVVVLGAWGAALLPAGSQPPGREKPAPEIITNSIGMKLALIPAGVFLMGAPESDKDAEEHEKPQHKVRITKPFYLLTTEVSQGQYKAVMRENPSEFKGDDLPVESVSWHAAALFCEVLAKREGRRFRLPTEAEWEYAARAGTNGPVSGTGKLAEMAWHADNSGNQPIDSANIWDTDSDNYFARITANGCRPRAVGTGTPNDWGVHDMQGNVSEWVGDWYEKDYFATSPVDDPSGPPSSALESRVIRGGSWGSDPRQCRVASRNWNNPWKQSGSRGFRVVMEAGSGEAGDVKR
jgi:formylglycine-generating enzyme required for sulfatase activity